MQTIYDDNGNQLGAWITDATFDAVGLTKTAGYSTGLDLAHSYDGINRLSSTALAGGGATLATYTYAGPHRLGKRVYDNGIVTMERTTLLGVGFRGRRWAAA